MDIIGLSRIGFTLIRTLLKTKKTADIETAKELAEVFHNLPENNNEFQHELIVKNIRIFVENYPEFLGDIEQHICLEN